MLFFIFVLHSLKCGFSRCFVEEVTLLCAQVVPIALQQQAVEAGRARDKGRVADVASVLPASSQVKFECNLCGLLILCICSWLIACLQAVLRSIAMLLAWAPTQQEDVANVLKNRFVSCSRMLHDVLFSFSSTAGASALGSQDRIRFVHKLLLQYARDQAHQRSPSLFS